MDDPPSLSFLSIYLSIDSRWGDECETDEECCCCCVCYFFSRNKKKKTITHVNHKKKFQLLELVKMVVPSIYDNSSELTHHANKPWLNQAIRYVDISTGWNGNNTLCEHVQETKSKTNISYKVTGSFDFGRYCSYQAGFKIRHYFLILLLIFIFHILVSWFTWWY